MGRKVDAQVPQNLQQARDFLETLTHVRVRLVGAPHDEQPSMTTDGPLGELILAARPSNKNKSWFDIKRHFSDAAWNRSAVEHIEIFGCLVAKNLDAMLPGKAGAEIRITFNGYEDGSCELAQIPEVREWARRVFVEGVPQAVGLLDDDTLRPAKLLCNKVRRHVHVVGPRGSQRRRHWN
jgi:hypothetical protein